MTATAVRSAAGKSVLLEIAPEDDASAFEQLGFRLFLATDNVFRYRGANEIEMHRMCEKLRDLGVPFSTHGYCGADEQINWLRASGFVRGRFKRIRKIANDWVGGRFFRGPRRVTLRDATRRFTSM